MPTDQQRAAQQEKAREHGDWRGDWERITGEPWSVESALRRVHPRDVVRHWREVFRSVRTGRFDLEYHLLNKRGRYVLVHGSTRRVGNDHVGIIEVIGDVAWADFANYVIRMKKN